MNMLVPQPSTLLTRIASTLEQDVLMEMAPSYAKTEVEAAVTLLRNLAGRVEWRQADLDEDLEMADDALLTISAGRVHDGASPKTVTTFDDLHTSRARLGAEIDHIFDRGATAPVQALAEVLERMVNAEERRNQRGR